MGKGARNRKIRMDALFLKKTTNDDRTVKSIARRLRKDKNAER